MKLGMVGLGKMGANMAERLRRHGREVLGADPTVPDADAATAAELVPLLAVDGQPTVVWSMVPSGAVTDGVMADLAEALSPGDLVVDGGNSNYQDSIRHGELLAAQGIEFIDCGTSGGVWGLENGYALMVGGSDEAVALAQPLFDALAPEHGYAHCGPIGSGHYVKMVHNGVEYGLMQAYAEGFAILEASPLCFIGWITVLHIEIGILPGIDRPVSNDQFHLIAALGAVAPCRHNRDVGGGLVLAWFEEQDVAGRCDFPGNGIAECHMSDFLVWRELHLDRRTDRADDAGDIVGLVADETHAIVLLRAGRNLQGLNRECGQCRDDGHGKERSFSQFKASGSARYSLTTNPSGFTNRSLEDIGALA